jgi:hypothetical protein
MKIKKTQNLVIVVLFLLSLPGSIVAQAGNHFCGDGAGNSYMTGSWNTFCGNYAGFKNTTGYANSFFGFHAGFENTTGSNNTFLGFRAGYANTEGNSNAFVGYNAGCANTTGVSNIFIGYGAGKSNITGSNNTFLGVRAGYSNTTGDYNTFLGREAGKSNTTANSNTFVGYQAGIDNIGGQENIFLGFQAGKSNAEGDRNIFIGSTAGHNNGGTDNVFIGYQAGYLELGSGKLYIANGKYPSDALIYGDFYNDKVGINTTSPAYELDVNGTVRADDFIEYSDIRLKKDVKTIEKALDQITRLRGVTFHWKDKKNGNGQQLGVIAQEVEKIFPQVVSTGGSGYKSVAYSNLVAPLIEAVKELKAENETLKARLEAIEKKLKD